MIRQMKTADAAAVAEIESICFGSEAWSEAAYIDTLSTPDAYYLVAEEEGRIVGMCGVINAAGDGDVLNVGVHPDYRGRGIARAMMEQLLAQGQNLGITAFTLEVRASNAGAIALYQSLGFESAGLRKRFYNNPVEDALILWKQQ